MQLRPLVDRRHLRFNIGKDLKLLGCSVELTATSLFLQSDRLLHLRVRLFSITRSISRVIDGARKVPVGVLGRHLLDTMGHGLVEKLG